MSKYGNKKTVVNGITFDSQKEAVRYSELMLLLRAGEIRNLKLQPEFTLKESFKMPDGERSGPTRYRADFSYEKLVRVGADTLVKLKIEDVKGYHTKEYEIKKKLMEDRGLRVDEL